METFYHLSIKTSILLRSLRKTLHYNALGELGNSYPSNFRSLKPLLLEEDEIVVFLLINNHRLLIKLTILG